MLNRNLISTPDSSNYGARADRSIQSARVLLTDTKSGEAILDVGQVDADGNPVYMVGVNFSPQAPPGSQDIVPLLRTNSSPYSMTIGGGAQVGGANSGQIVSNGGVMSLAKSGSAKLRDDVTLTGTGGIVLNPAGQNIAIDGSGLTPPLPATTVTDVGASGVVGTATTYAREDHVHRGLQSIAKSGSAEITGDATVTGIGGISITQLGNNLAFDGSGVSAAPVSAHYVTTQAESGLSAEFSLGTLTTGLLKHAVSAGVSTPATAVAGTDYYNPGGTDVAVADGGTGSSTAAGARTNLGVAVQSISLVLNNGDSALAVGQYVDVVAEYACTISQATLLADQSGSCVIDLRKCTYAQFDDSTHPVSGDSICASAKPTLSSAVKSQDSTLTGWGTSLSAGDILRAYVESATSITQVTLSLKVSRA